MPHMWGFCLNWWGAPIFSQPQNQDGVEERQTQHHPSTLFCPHSDLWGPYFSPTHTSLAGSWVRGTPQFLHTSTHVWKCRPCLLPQGSPVLWRHLHGAAKPDSHQTSLAASQVMLITVCARGDPSPDCGTLQI